MERKGKERKGKERRGEENHCKGRELACDDRAPRKDKVDDEDPRVRFEHAELARDARDSAGVGGGGDSRSQRRATRVPGHDDVDGQRRHGGSGVGQALGMVGEVPEGLSVLGSLRRRQIQRGIM